MKHVEFVKDHVAGIKKGSVTKLVDNHAARLEKEGYVKITGDAGDDEDTELLGGDEDPKNKKGKK
jgi:hypothetical protein